MVILIIYVYGAFSSYLARRNLDAELGGKEKKISLEYLQALSDRERYMVIETLQDRCAERQEIGQYNASNMEYLDEIFKKVWPIEQDLITFVADRNKTKSYDSVLKQMNSARFDFANFSPANVENFFAVADPAIMTGQDHADILAKARTAYRTYEQIYQNNKARWDAIDKSTLDGLDRLGMFEQRIDRLRDQRKTSQTTSDLADILARYRSWTDAFTGGGINAQVDDFETSANSDDNAILASSDCNSFRAVYTMSTGRSVEFGYGVPWFERPYFKFMQSLFGVPPIAQTLVVTLLLGALGGLTVNILRLSKVDWWGTQPEPTWGEIVLCPLLGAVAAFGVFLLGSTGLLLTSDVKSSESAATALSAFFIGLLGFISGLLYDEAFARVRRTGTQFFAGDGSPGATIDPDDASLRKTLTEGGASLIASLVPGFQLGADCAKLTGFTFVVPIDDAVRRWSTVDWLKIAAPEKRAVFMSWVAKRRIASDVTLMGLGNALPVKVATESGDTASFNRTANGLTINDVDVVMPDVKWKNGIIHFVRQDIF